VKAATLHKSDFVQQNAANTKTNKKNGEKLQEIFFFSCYIRYCMCFLT